MPVLGDIEEVKAVESPTQAALLKLLLIGDSKAGKTDYAVSVANQGYNVLYFDGDVGIQTINSMAQEGRLTKEALSRIAYFNIGDHPDEKGNYVTRFADFWKDFTTASKFVWNDTLAKQFSNRDYQPHHRIWELFPGRLDQSTVLIFDSWSAYAQSVMQWKADTIGEDLSEIEKIGRDVYAGVGNKLTQTLTLIQRMPCHVIVIAHPDEYVKMSNPKGIQPKDKEKNAIIEWSKMVPKSSSRPHSLTMASKFSDVGWIELQPSRKRNISFIPSTERVIGGHFTDSKSVEERPVSALIEKIGGAPAAFTPMDTWLTRYGPGEYVSAGSKPGPVLQQKANPADSEGPAPQSSPTKIGLAAMLGKPKGVER